MTGPLNDVADDGKGWDRYGIDRTEVDLGKNNWLEISQANCSRLPLIGLMDIITGRLTIG